MIRILAGFAFLALGASGLYAQDDGEKARQEIYDSIKSRLDAARGNLTRGIGRIVEQELARKASAESGSSKVQEQIKRLEARLRQLRDEEARIRLTLLKLRWSERDADVLMALKKEGGIDGQQASTLFNESLNALRDKDYDVANEGFKKIYYQFRSSQNPSAVTYASVCAYNVACGYSLMEKKKEALDWLEISYSMGFLQSRAGRVEHVQQDTDLDNIREEGRFKKLLNRFSGQ